MNLSNICTHMGNPIQKKNYAYLQITLEHTIWIPAQDYTCDQPYNDQKNEKTALFETPRRKQDNTNYNTTF
jgi:hypothetical protein